MKVEIETLEMIKNDYAQKVKDLVHEKEEYSKLKFRLEHQSHDNEILIEKIKTDGDILRTLKDEYSMFISDVTTTSKDLKIVVEDLKKTIDDLSNGGKRKRRIVDDDKELHDVKKRKKNDDDEFIETDNQVDIE